MKQKKVIVGLSGGVDSAVACFLLKEQNYDVEAIFMDNWDSFINNEFNYQSNEDGCNSKKDYLDAIEIAKKLNIKLHKVNFTKEYWEQVFQKLIIGYKKGKTPNPDILCNKYIKFDMLLNYAFDNFNADFIATGHYANIEEKDGFFYLLQPADKSKDQTYFLSELNQEQLSKTIFPLASLLKKEVREIAQKNNMDIWNKKDSSGICFIGKRKFKTFISNYINPKIGDIINLENNQKIGEHDGAFYYTIGQNKNLNLSGLDSKYYVIKKDIKKNILYVSRQEIYRNNFIKEIIIKSNFNWISKVPNNLNNITVITRHLQKQMNCDIEFDKDKFIIKLKDNVLNSVSEGQYAVLYQNGICLGGNEIIGYKW